MTFLEKMTPEMRGSWSNLELNYKYKPETILFQEQQSAKGLFSVNSGSVRVSMNDSQGRRLNIEIANQGCLLGLVPAFSGGVYDTTAETIETSDVGFLSHSELMRFITHYPDAKALVMDEIVRTLGVAHAALRVIGLPSKIEERLVRLWLNWAKPSDNSARLEMKMTLEELGAFVGASREGTTRIISRFKKENLITMKHRVITIPSISRLQSFVGMGA